MAERASGGEFAPIIVWGMNGGVEPLLTVEEERIEWGDESRTLDCSDVMRMMKIGNSEVAYYDLILLSAPAGSGLVQTPMHSDDVVEWGCSYTLYRRPCPRCTLCNRACQREGVHKLCSHVCVPVANENCLHLWHTLNKKKGVLSLHKGT